MFPIKTAADLKVPIPIACCKLLRVKIQSVFGWILTILAFVKRLNDVFE